MTMSDSESLLKPSRLQFKSTSDTEDSRLIGQINNYYRGNINMRPLTGISPLSQNINSKIQNTINKKNKKDSSIAGPSHQDGEQSKSNVIGKVLKNVFSSSDTSGKNRNNEIDDLRNDISQLRADMYALLKDKNSPNDNEKESLREENAYLREMLQNQNKKKHESDSHYSSYYNDSEDSDRDSNRSTRRKKYTRSRQHIKIVKGNLNPNYGDEQNLKEYENHLSALEANLVYGDKVTAAQLANYKELNNRRHNYLVKKIFADQEENYSPSLAIMPKLRSDRNINVNYVKEIKDLKGVTLLPLSKDFSIYSFISQFDGYQLSEPEYNMIVIHYLDIDTRASYLSQYEELPKNTKTSVFLERLIDLKAGSATNAWSIRNEIQSYKTNATDIITIYSALVKILNKSHPKEITQEDKNMMLYTKIKEFLPVSLLPDYIRQAKNSNEGRRAAPDRSALHRYLRLFEEPINMHLGEQGGKMYRGQVNQTMVEVDNRYESPKNSNFKKAPKCEICQKFGHSTEKCFQHPINGERNLKNAKFCLLCRSKKHLSPECYLYPNSIFIVEGCRHCKNKGYYACHPSESCKGVDQIYADYVKMQKAADESRKNYTSSLKN